MHLKFLYEDKLDFHEFGLLNHFEVEKILSEFLEDNYNSNVRAVLIVTGTGHMVKPLVDQLLKKSKFVREFCEAGYFNGQRGAYEVILKAVVDK